MVNWWYANIPLLHFYNALFHIHDSGNKDAYKNFLVEFFDDPDFAALRESLGENNTSDAFEYAHGLKGMAANLGLDAVYQPLSKLVEILRQGSMEGAMDAYKQVCDACKVVTALL